MNFKDILNKYLKKQDPRVLQSVMKHMGWEFKQRRHQPDCKKSKESRREELDKWEIDMLCKMAGIPCRRLEQDVVRVAKECVTP